MALGAIGKIVGGALIGGLLGGSGSKQAGTTTTTTTNDLPEWLKPYVVGNLDLAKGLRDSTLGDGSALIDQSQAELSKTLSGAYLTPESNPFLRDIARMVTEDVGAGVDSRFSAAGRFGSGAHQGVLGRAVSDALTRLYGGAYDAERGRMASTAISAPSVVQGGVQAQFQPLTSFSSLIPNLSTSTATQPYFENRGGNILSGALIGAGLGKMFGG